LYGYDREVDLSYSEDADYYGAWTDGLTSSFDSSRYAAYGQLDWTSMATVIGDSF